MKLWRVFEWLLFAGLVFGAPIEQAAAQSCRWDGTAPFCSGECGGDETEVTRLGSIPDFWIPPYVNVNPPFGSNCLTGTKALCCKMPGGPVCRYDGTAPFCEGACREGEQPGTPPPGSSSGAGCLTGSKVYCCHSTPPGTISFPIEANPKYSRFAAIFEESSGFPWAARHGLTAQEFQAAFDDLTGQGYRLIDISGYSVNDQPRYAALWEQRPDGVAWFARPAMTSADFQQEFDRLAQEGYRLVHVSGYTVGNQVLYAAIWDQHEGPARVARHDMTSAEFQQEFDRLGAEGFRPVDISGYSIGGQDRYAVIWEQRQDVEWGVRHDMTATQYQEEFNAFALQGYRLTHISGWRSGSSTHYAALWERREGPGWTARHGLLIDAYQEAFDALVGQGYQLKQISGYHTYD